MSSGEERFASGDVTPRRKHPQKKRRAEGRHTAPEALCYLCKGFPVHVKGCWNELRARVRVLDQNRAMRNGIAEQRRKQWRKEMAPFSESGDTLQRKIAVAALKQEVSRVIKSTTEKQTEKKLADDLILSRVRYVSYHCFWDRLTPSEASEEFWNEHSDQDGEHDDAEPRVRMKDNDRVRVSDGVSTAKGTQQETVVGDTAFDEHQANSRKRRARSTTPKFARGQPRRGGGFGDDGDRRHRDRSSSPKTTTTRGRSCASENPGGGADDDLDDRHSVDTLMSARLGLGGLKKAGKERRPRGCPMPSRPLPGIDNTPERPSALLKLKKDMKTQLEKLIEDMTGKKGWRGKIERMYDGAGRPDDATKKPDGAYKTLEDACSQCKDLVIRLVDIVTAKEADAMKKKIEEVQDVCNNAALEVGGYVERIEFIAKEKSSNSRKTKMKVRHEKERIGKLLIPGFSPSKMAKWLEEVMHKLLLIIPAQREKTDGEEDEKVTIPVLEDCKTTEFLKSPEENNFTT